MEVSIEDLEAANEAIKALKKDVEDYILTVRVYMELNRGLAEKWEEQQAEIQRLRARLSEFEVQS